MGELQLILFRIKFKLGFEVKVCHRRFENRIKLKELEKNMLIVIFFLILKWENFNLYFSVSNAC